MPGPGNWAKGRQGFQETVRASNQVTLDSRPVLPKAQPRRIRSMVDEGVDPEVYTRARVEDLIADGVLAPSARSMSSKEVVDQWSAANASSLREREQFANRIGVFVTVNSSELTAGDWIDMEPIIRAWGDPSDPAFPGQLAEASTELVEVEAIERDSWSSVAIGTRMGFWVLPAGFRVSSVLAGADRCPVCSERLLGQQCTWCQTAA